MNADGPRLADAAMARHGGRFTVAEDRPPPRAPNPSSAVVAGDWRTPEQKARDTYRHPVER